MTTTATIDSRSENFCQTCSVRNRAICSDLSDAEIDVLNAIGRRRNLEAGENLLWEGDEALLVANVISGMLKLSTHTADGKEQILGLAYPSDFLGRPFGETTPHGAQALIPSQVCVFARADFDRYASEHPRLEHKLLERTLQELDRTRRWMLLLGRMNAEQKVASFLLEMSAQLLPDFGDDSMGIELPLTRQQVADILGLTIETVSRQLSAFRKQGLIDLPSRREVVLVERTALEDIAGQ